MVCEAGMTRELRCKIEYRADDSRQSPGRIVGTLMTYGERAADRPEVFAADSLRWGRGRRDFERAT